MEYLKYETSLYFDSISSVMFIKIRIFMNVRSLVTKINLRAILFNNICLL